MKLFKSKVKSKSLIYGRRECGPCSHLGGCRI